MRDLSMVAPRGDDLTTRLLAGAIKAWFGLWQMFIAAPTLLFLVALTAMLFCHPDVLFHKLNRVTFGLLVLSVFGRAVVLKQPVFRFERASFPMIALLAVVLISLIGRPVDEETWGLLAAKYLFPFTLFYLAQFVFTGEREIRRFEVLALVLLAYLSFTAIAFLLGAHALVFPRFILDPSLGHHINRARGPFLQAVANGVSLNLLGVLVLHGYWRGTLRNIKTLMLLASVPIAILATMTRAVWLSFAGSLLALVFLSKSKLRLGLIAVLILAAGGLGVMSNTTQFGGIIGERMAESAPVEFRKAVYAGGWQMFLDRPLAGWGFHLMPAALPDYVGEFHGQVLYPHNTYLEILVENGLLGFSLYLWLMWELWRLGREKLTDGRAQGFLDSDFHRLWPIFLAVYWVNAAVVVMSYQFVNGLLFTVAGILAAQRRRAEVGRAC